MQSACWYALYVAGRQPIAELLVDFTNDVDHKVKMRLSSLQAIPHLY